MDFREAEVRFAELQRSLRKKAIAQATFYQEASKLMVQDPGGQYWAIDPVSGGWLYHDGRDWAPALPPTVHTQVNKIVRRRSDRWPLILGASVAVLLCALVILVALAWRSVRPLTPSPVTPASTVRIEFTISLETPTTEPTAGTPQPAVTPVPSGILSADVTDRRRDAEFVSDVTISDKQAVPRNQRFDKTWRMRNTGTCAWIGFAWTYVSGEHMNGPDFVAVRRTEPGDTVDISVPLYAEGDPGTYAAMWQLRDPDGRDVGQPAQVRVVVLASPTATLASP